MLAATTVMVGSVEVSAAPPVDLSLVGRFARPTFVTGAPGDRDRVFVVEQPGQIRVVRGGLVLSRAFLDLRSRVSSTGERGLLSMAFSPDYASSGRFYVDYTDRRGDINVVEYRRSGDPDKALSSSARLVLRQSHRQASNHNGGLLVFGPDGLLYIGIGDGGGSFDRHGPRGNAQSLRTLLGKILRIDPRRHGRRPYLIPAGNPFVHRRGARGEIYAYGLRNPWRFSFDPATGKMVIADVGEHRQEEIDFAPKGKGAGANYGWRVFEGNLRVYRHQPAPGAVKPVLTYDHSNHRCAIVGGYTIRDPSLPALAGRYLYGDYCTGELRTVKLSAGNARDDQPLHLRVSSLTSFGQDTSGRLYATSFYGPVYRLAPSG